MLLANSQLSIVIMVFKGTRAHPKYVWQHLWYRKLIASLLNCMAMSNMLMGGISIDVRVDIHTYPIFHDGIKYAVVARAEELKKYHAWVLKTINLH